MVTPAPSPAGAPTQSWLDKWSEWEIQAVVAVSFSLQVILFFLAGIRRYSISSVLKVLLWLVYLLADTAAIYALGHMSASLSKTSSDKHQLVAFWAPFLLLHLGGQDTITAYALEDNKLWLRHLLNMCLQVAVTGYVLYKYIIADRVTIVSAALWVSAAGFLKYGERIWALKRASKASTRGDHLHVMLPRFEASDCFTRNIKFRTYAFIVMGAHALRYMFVKPLILERNQTVICSDSLMTLRHLRHVEYTSVKGDKAAQKKRRMEFLYREIEVQLTLMYDMLYTKAEVIHTRYGYLIRVICFVSCFGALVAFTRSNRDHYSTTDIGMTFVLVGGACALELASAFKVIGSTWTYVILTRYRWFWLANAILFARYHLMVVKEGRWSNYVGQYDLVSFCASDNTGLKRRMIRWIGLEDWWNNNTKHAKLSPVLKEFVWDLLTDEKSDMVNTEDVATQRGSWGRKLTGFNQSEMLDWSLRMEFHNCVFIWHIATNTFLSNPAVKSNLVNTGMAGAVNTLSDYMMYLLVQHPDILPTNAAARTLPQRTCFSFMVQWNRRSEKYIDEGNLDAPHQIILDHMERYPNNGGNLLDLASSIGEYDLGEEVLLKASILVRIMVNMELELTHKLVIIGTAWKEMLCYAATNAVGDFHARQLSNGGEFVTHILLLYTCCYGEKVFPNFRPWEVAAHVKPRVEVAADDELNVHNDREEGITDVP